MDKAQSPLGTPEPSPNRDSRPWKRDSGGWLKVIDALVSYDARTWLLIPLHILVFIVLYFATLNLLENGFFQAASESSKLLLQDIVVETPLLAPVVEGETGPNHLFAHLLAAHQEIDLRLYDLAGESLTKKTPSDLITPLEVTEFARSGEVERFWLGSDPSAVQMSGLMQVVGEARCEPCHSSGQVLALASMSFDYTKTFESVRSSLKINLAILLVVWILSVGATNILVHTSVGRSSRKLQKNLEAALDVGGKIPEGSELVLDPKLAEMHESLRRFLDRQRARDSHVSERLEHTDRLASLGQLAAGLAHEIKNPLAGIQGALEILRQDLAEETTGHELCDRMLEEMDRVNHTLQLLLTSARPNPPKLAASNVAELLEETRQLMVHKLRKQNIDLEVVVAPDLEPAWIDSAKIRQVLINLIGNAGDAIDGSGRVVVRAGSFPQGGGLILTVEDDGPGIGEELRSQIFEPFFTTRFGGTGLGLAIARRLVEQHQGRLQVESTVGSGATFLMLIPDVRNGSVAAVDGMLESGDDDGDDSAS